MGLAILFVMFFSAFYIAAEAHHHCTGENCPVCVRIQQCEKQIRQLGSGAAVQAVVAVIAAFFVLPQQVCNVSLSVPTPVSQKVRMNN